MSKLELYIIDVIQGKKKGLFASFIKLPLFFLSLLYRLGIAVRNKAYDCGLLSKYRPPVPLIISIGNIVAGGAGKTPATILIAEQFYDDFKIAILSRGYRSSSEKESFPTFLSTGTGPLHPASYCGDEPYLISETLPKAICIVGKNKHEASNLAAKMGADLILIDDGMQHRHLARDLEVVVMDAKDPFGHHHFLPRGFLREEITALSRANLIILNPIDSLRQFEEIKNQLPDFIKAPIIGCQLVVTDIYDLFDVKIETIEGKKVGLFCAIAKPDKFERTILDEKAEILAEYNIADHTRFEIAKLKEFSEHCKQQGADILLCTEKDRVKLPKYLELSLPIFVIKVNFKVNYGVEEWKSFIQNAKKAIIH